MLVIDEHADSKLIEQLEMLRESPDSSRCLHFKKNVKRESVIASVARHLSDHTPQVYLCDDGDVFVLSTTFPVKEAKLVMLEVAVDTSVAVTEEFVSFYEITMQVNKILVELQSKIDARRKIAEEAQKKQEEEHAARKRHDILNSDVLVMNAATIDSRRKARELPEIMIIEDDAFSRRLVDNVLGKQFSLTQLATADLALPMYAKVAPDLLFLDINLPDVTGLELLEKFIKLDPNAYIIMLSGNADKDNIMQAMGSGAKGFVAKPFNREKLFQYIERCPTIKK
jgi:two-component system chemotaxis response regulator CheY